MTASRRALMRAAALAALTAGCAPDPATADGSGPLEVGVLPADGPFAAGFGAGLASATNGTNRIGNRHISVIWAGDDPLQAAEQLITRGVRVLVGGRSDAVARQLAALAAARHVLYISGPATTDALTGINRHTFRSGRQAYQDLRALAAVAFPTESRDAVLIAPDAAALAAASPVLGVPGVVMPGVGTPGVGTPAVPRSDRVIVLPGQWQPPFWRSLVQQHAEVITFLGARRTWRFYGTAATGLKFAAYFFDGADDNFALRAMRSFAPGRPTDLGQPEGFAAGQMAVRALQYSPDIDRMITGLEGFTFGSVNGQLTVRASDHALLQPMFQARLIAAGRGYRAITGAKFNPTITAPP